MRQLTRIDDSYTEAETLDLLTDLACRFARKGGSQGSHIESLLRKKDLYSVCHYDVVYSDLSPQDVEPVRAVRQALSLFQKLEFLDIGIDKQLSATETFIAAENRCRETNEIFRLWSKGMFSFKPQIERVFFRAQQLIADTLGEVPSVSNLKLRLGPGATTLTKKRDASIVEKFTVGLACSEEFVPWASTVMSELPMVTDLFSDVDFDDGCDAWSRVTIQIMDGVLSFAKKNAKTERIVVKQPPLNVMAQLAIADPLQHSLLRRGVDLKNQLLNQELAKEGSLYGRIATLDLKSASDLIAIELVAHLLPIDWFSVLNAWRVGKLIVPWSERAIKLEQFSSMGNGFTFPLESLIFWALSHAAVEISCSKDDEFRRATVYGDDIIVPTSSALLVREVLSCAGFLVNTQKSYWTGPFRESCGADFLFGIDIRPIYVKRKLDGAGLFSLHNGLVRKGWNHEAEWVRTFISPKLAIFGPDGYGDGHLLGPWDPKAHNRQFGWGGYTFKTYKEVPNKDLTPLKKGYDVLPHYSTYMGAYAPILPQVPSLANANFRTLRELARVRGRDGTNYVCVLEPSKAIPEVACEFGFKGKFTTIPGFTGYKKVSIYTLEKD